MYAAVPRPADWVPIRWPWADVQSLDLLTGGPLNCLLLKAYSPALVAAAAERGVAALAVVAPDQPAGAVAAALRAGVAGIVLEGRFPQAAVAAARRQAGGLPVIELSTRSDFSLRDAVPVTAIRDGVWPGIVIEESGSAKAGPTGSVWIGTNTGALRAIRAACGGALWIANEPPPHTIITTGRYLQAVADAGAAGARWVVALDDDFAARLARRQPSVLRDWQRILEVARYFEAHPEWRRMRLYGQIAVLQDLEQGALLSGGILDMLAAGHRPARPLTREMLSDDGLRDVKLAVDLDPAPLSSSQQNALRRFTAGGGQVLHGPPIWKPDSAQQERLDLNKAEFDLLDRMAAKIDELFPQRSSDIRLFNVSSMLSQALASEDGRELVIQLVNYSEYPAENITLAFPEGYRRAALLSPESPAVPLEISRENGRNSVMLPNLRVCAAVRLGRAPQ